MRSEQAILGPRARAFDVICAGEALWKLEERDAPFATEPTLRLRPGGGAVNAALALAGQGLRVGVATVLGDDTFGRKLLAKIVASGTDTGGVELTKPSSNIVFVKGRGGARQIVSSRDEEQPITVPEGWSSQVLLLSGMSPLVSHGAALCKAARAARRAGSTVVVDVNARWHLWQGRDPRSIRMVLREADVVWCSAQDLFGLNLDLATLRGALRRDAVLVSSDGAGTASASGPFGEIVHVLPKTAPIAALREGDAFTAAICAELVRAGQGTEGGGELWTRALERGHVGALEHTLR